MMTRRLMFLSLFFLTFCCVQPVLAQEDSSLVIDSVDTSIEYKDIYIRAMKLIEANDYKNAIPLLQQLLEHAGDKLIKDKNGAYISCKSYLEELLINSPADALEAYRNQFSFETQAEQALIIARKSMQKADIEKIYRKFFLTNSAAAALELAGNMYMEQGEFAEAIKTWTLLYKHPNKEFQPVALMNLVLSYSFVGNEYAAKKYLAIIEKDFPDTQTTANIRKLNILAFLKEFGEPILKTYIKVVQQNIKATEKVCSVIKPDKEWSLEYRGGDRPFVPNFFVNVPLNEQNPPEEPNNRRYHGLLPNPTYPIHHDGKIYIMNGQLISTIDIKEKKFVNKAIELSDSPILNKMDFHNNWILFPMENKNETVYNNNTGKFLQLTAKDPEDKAFLNNCINFSIPAIHENYVYLCLQHMPNAGGRKDFWLTFYLAAFSLDTGELVWKRHLASRENNKRKFAPAKINIFDGKLYCATNNGIILSANPRLGTINWLIFYSKGNNTFLWRDNPLIITKGLMLVAPEDIANEIWAIDPDTGTVKWKKGVPVRIDRGPMGEGENILDYLYLLGIDDKNVYTVATKVYAFNIENGKEQWESEAFTGSASTSLRPVIAEDHIYITTPIEMMTVSKANGSFLFKRKWTTEEGKYIVGLPCIETERLFLITANMITSFRDKDYFKGLAEKIKKNDGDKKTHYEMMLEKVRYQVANKDRDNAERDLTEILEYAKGAKLRELEQKSSTEIFALYFNKALRLSNVESRMAQLEKAFPFAKNPEDIAAAVAEILKIKFDAIPFDERLRKNASYSAKWKEIVALYRKIKDSCPGTPINCFKQEGIEYQSGYRTKYRTENIVYQTPADEYSQQIINQIIKIQGPEVAGP